MAVQSQVKSSLSPEKRAVYAAHPGRIFWLTGLCGDLDFPPRGRTENIQRIGEVSRIMKNTGLLVVVAFISPFRAARDSVRVGLPTGKFTEVYVNT